MLLPVVAFVDCGVLAEFDIEYDFFASYVVGRFGVSGTSGVPPAKNIQIRFGFVFVVCLNVVIVVVIVVVVANLFAVE